jgi:MYXO-CTERM domain-containing protein
MRTVFIPLTVALTLALPCPEAEACSPPQCTNQLRLTVNDLGELPASAAAVGLLQRSWDFVPDAGITLHTADGRAVPHTVFQDGPGWFVWPTQRFTANELYVLRYGRTCLYDAWENEPSFGEAWFRTTETVLPPERLGALTVGEASVQDFGPGTSCGGPAERNAVVHLDITVADELVPWLGLAEFTLVIDGEQWAHRPYGMLRSDGTDSWDPWDANSRRLTTVHARCPGQDDGPPWGDPGVSGGRHTAALHGQFFGMARVIASPPVEFVLTCDGADGGVAPADGGVDGGGLKVIPAAEWTNAPAAGCGCASGAAGTAGAAWSLLLLLLARAVRSRRQAP